MATEQRGTTTGGGPPSPTDTHGGPPSLTDTHSGPPSPTDTHSGPPSPTQADEPAIDPTPGAEMAEAARSEATQTTTADAKATAGMAPDDPWTAFAPAPEPPPSRGAVTFDAAVRFLGHEWTLATLGALVLAILMTWPTIWFARDTIPQDIWDPTLQAWAISWSGHALITDPAQLWHANAFFPERYTLAFTDSLLGYAPLGILGDGPVAAVVRYNVVYILLHALAFLGAYALVRQLGAGPSGAAVAAAAFGYAPWRLAQAGHIHVLSTGGIALALAMLARGHGWSLRHGYRPERRRPGWVVAGWLVAAWQLTIGFGIGLAFAYFLAAAVVVVAAIWVGRRLAVGSARPHPPFGGRLLVANLLGGAAFAGTGVLMALPYFEVVVRHPHAKRSIADLEIFSAPLSAFFTAPPESKVWGELHASARAGLPWAAEQTLLPGFVLIGLAAAGLIFSIWTARQRAFLAGGVAVTVALAMGTRFAGGGEIGYVALYEYLPGWDGIRTPGRLVLWTTLLLGILAAGAVCAFGQRVSQLVDERAEPRPGVWLRLAMLVPLVLVLGEGLNNTPHPIVPAQPAAMREAPGPLLVLPSDGGTDNHVMLWSTSRFQPIVNGNSGFVPLRLDQIRRTAETFPDQASIAALREQRVAAVLVLHDRIDRARWQAALEAPVEVLGVTRQDIDGDLLFQLSP